MQSDESLTRIIQAYEQIIKNLEAKHKSELQAKDRKIEFYRQKSSELNELITLLARRPVNVKITNEVKSRSVSKAMSDKIDQSRKIEITGGTVNASGAGALSLGDISGTVANTINQLSDSAKPDEPGIKELLTQLQTAIEAETDLSDDDKAEALEQVKTLAEVGKNPQESTMQKAGKTAMKILKGTIAGLPSTARRKYTDYICGRITYSVSQKDEV
ncbi:low-complexity protein, partial [Microcoleus sp. AT9_B5]